MPFLSTSKLITIERHIAEEGALHPKATGEFSHLLRDFTLALRILDAEGGFDGSLSE